MSWNYEYSSKALIETKKIIVFYNDEQEATINILQYDDNDNDNKKYQDQVFV